ncbi:lipopolysaccharide biosynthesis protein [Phytohabitans suffuscus]|uniref:lipopolysaccharide biosynthesis protein n=1 Tax=Phytohabitans suffuscus TaxID=624315 RepID=UPI002F963010
MAAHARADPPARRLPADRAGPGRRRVGRRGRGPVVRRARAARLARALPAAGRTLRRRAGRHPRLPPAPPDPPAGTAGPPGPAGADHRHARRRGGLDARPVRGRLGGALPAGGAARRVRAAPRLPLGAHPARRPGHKTYLALRARFWRYTGPRSLASVAQLALQRVDVLLVAMLGGLAAAAVYAVASRFVVLGQLANQGISQSVQPRLAEALSTGDRLTANHLYQTATGWLVLVTWPLHLMVITYAPAYLGLFGDGYQAGGPVVVVLASAMLVATGCGMVDMVLSMAGRTRWNLTNVTAALALMVALDLALVPRFGAVGAAVGLAAAVLVNNIAPLVQVGHALGIHPFGPGTVAAAGLAVACFGVLPQVSAAIAGTGPAALLTAAAVALSCYGVGVWRMRGRLGLLR